MQVLVIDDNNDVATTTAIIFQSMGCQAEIMNDARNVIDKVETLKPDLIVMDIGMPEINGYELCRTLHDKDASAMIVAHTGWGGEEDLKKAREAGFDDILIKPVRWDQYQAIVEKCKERETSASL